MTRSSNTQCRRGCISDDEDSDLSTSGRDAVVQQAQPRSCSPAAAHVLGISEWPKVALALRDMRIHKLQDGVAPRTPCNMDLDIEHA